MSDLTKEYLDKKLDRLATKEDIEDVKGLVKTEVGRLETKIETEVAELAGMMSRRFDEIEKELNVKDKVDNLDRRMFKIEQALNIKNQFKNNGTATKIEKSREELITELKRDVTGSYENVKKFYDETDWDDINEPALKKFMEMVMKGLQEMEQKAYKIQLPPYFSPETIRTRE